MPPQAPLATSSVHDACIAADWALLEQLLSTDHGNIVDKVNSDGESLLIAVISQRAPASLIQTICSKTSNINQAGFNGLTPLAFAVESGASLEVITLLLQHGANPNARDNHGWTPLLLAADMDHCDQNLIELLLRHGANRQARLPSGHSAHMLAEEHNANPNILRLLLETRHLQSSGSGASSEHSNSSFFGNLLAGLR